MNCKTNTANVVWKKCWHEYDLWASLLLSVYTEVMKTVTPSSLFVSSNWSYKTLVWYGHSFYFFWKNFLLVVMEKFLCVQLRLRKRKLIDLRLEYMEEVMLNEIAITVDGG